MNHTNVIIIGIAGGSASGKSAVAEYLASKANFKVHVVSQDWYYKSLPDGVDGKSYNWDSPSAFDWDQLIESINALKSGLAIWTPRHDYITYKKRENVERVKPNGVIIIEGLMMMQNPVVRNLLDMKIFIECDTDITLKRRILRDVKERGYDVEQVLERYTKHVKPSFEENIKPTAAYADIILCNDDNRRISEHKGIDLILQFINNNIPKNIPYNFLSYS